jgi:hypothetical protein
MRGVLFHKIGRTELDVSRVVHMFIHKRLFMIRERHFPYTLSIKYFHPEEITSVSPLFGTGGFSIHDSVKLYQDLEFRVSSIQEAEVHISSINEKITKLQLIRDKILLSMDH